MGAETYVNDEISKRSEAVGLLLVLAELPSVPDQELSQSLLLSGHLQPDVHLLYLLRTAKESSQDGHGLGRVAFGILPHAFHLLNVAIWRQT